MDPLIDEGKGLTKKGGPNSLKLQNYTIPYNAPELYKDE
jgi:hypothetical protein